MKRKLISIALIICIISLTLTPMTMIVSAEGDSGENEEMNALEALGIDTSQAPEGYDPDSRDNPYGKDTVTINPVGEFYTIGLDRITTHSDIMPSIRDDHGTSVTEYVYQSVYNELKSTIYGHEKWEADTAEEILDGGLETGIESGVSEVTGTYLASEILTSEYPRLQSIAVDTTLEGGNKLALTAVAAGNFDGNTEGKKAQVAMVYTGALHKNGGLYLKVGDIGEDYGTSKTLLSASADIGNPNAKLNGERIETFDSAPYLMQNYLRVSTGDYDGDGRDEIAVYIPELGGSRIQVYKLRTTSGDNDYKAGSQWEVAWTYSLKETTYVSNMVSLVSGDFNSDGVDDIAATWGYYYGPEDNKGSTAVVLFGSNDGDMLQSSQEFSLTYGQSEIVRGAFAFGDLTGAGQDTLILGGQLNSDIEDGNLNSRFVALYSWDGTKFIQGIATNFDLFDKDDDGALVHPAMNRNNEAFYSSPLCITNLDVIGQGLGENAKLYIDSLILGYGESGLTIEAALDITSQMQSDKERPVSYVEYGAAATDLVGLGKESIATMQQTFSQVDIETLSEIITELRTYVYYDYEYYYENWFYRLFGIKSWRLVQKTYTVTGVTELTDNLRTYVPGTTYMLMMDISESYSSRTAVDASASLCVANTDADTTFLNYNRKYFTYSDPEILAVLASPPYFRDLMERDDLSGSYGESSTSYSKTEGGSSGVTATATISLGAYIGFEQEFSVFGVKVASVEAEIAIKTSFTYDFEYTSSLEQTVTYTAAAGEDMVAFYSIPLEIFEFEASVPDGEGGYKTQIMNVNIPHEASVKLMPLDDYEAIAADYDILPQIAGTILTHTVGDPSSYPGSTNGYNVIAEYKGTPSSVGFSSAGAAQSQEIAMGTETTYAFSSKVAIETKAGAGAGGVTVGIIAGIEGGAGYVMTSTSGSSFSGEIHNMPVEAEPFAYGHSWRVFCYEYYDGLSNFPVVNYVVTDVSVPPELPSDFGQNISETTDDTVVLTWSYDKSVAGFQLYRYYEFPDGSGSYELAFVNAASGIEGEDGRLYYRYEDKGLAPYTDYSYQIQTVRAALPSRSIKSEVLTARTKTSRGYPKIILEGEGLQDGVLPIYPDSSSVLKAVVQNPEDYPEGFSYQWQALLNGVWTNLSGKTEDTLTFKSSGSADQAQYRCRINTIYYDEGQGNTYYISAYSEAVYAKYSKRTAVVAADDDTGEARFTAEAEGDCLKMSISLISGNAGHVIAPIGNVTFVINGTDYLGYAVGVLNDDGTQDDGKAVSTAEAEADNLKEGVYEVTAIYNGSRIFKSLTVDEPRTVLVGDAAGYQLNLTDGGSKATRFTYGTIIIPQLNEIKIEGNEVTTTQITNDVTYLIKDAEGNTVDDTITAGFNTPDVGAYTLVAKVGYNEAARRSFIVMKKPITVEIPSATVGGSNVEGNKPRVQLQAGSSMAFNETFSSLNLTYIARNTADNVVSLDNETPAGKYFVTPVPSGTSDIGNYEITYISGVYTIIGRTYDVTYEAVPFQGTLAGTVTLTNEGSKFAAAERLLFSAAPYNGYEIDTWTVTLLDSPYTVLDTQEGGFTFNYEMKDEPIHVAVTFAMKEVTLTTAVQGGSGTIKGPQYFVSGSAVTPGAELTFKAIPAAGYHFVKWMKVVGISTTDLSGNMEADGTNTLTLTMGSSSTRLYAVFARDSYTLTLEGNLLASYYYDHDGLSTTDDIEKIVSSGAVIPGDTQVTVRVRTGYEAESTAVWKQDGVNVTADEGNQSYTFVMVKNTTISVPTVRGKYMITTYAENGSVKVTLNGAPADGDDLQEVPGGTKVTLTAVPNYGYELDCWTVNGEVSEQEDYTFIISELGGNIEITASFKELASYDVSIALDKPLRASLKYTIIDHMGRVVRQNFSIGSGEEIPVCKGDTLTVTVIPKENFMVGKWIVNGNVIDSRQKTYTIENINENTDIQIDLAAQISCRVYYSDDISLATVDGDPFESGAMIGCGTTVAFHANPEAGKMVEKWILNGDAANIVKNKYGEPLVDKVYIIDGLPGTVNVSVAFKDIDTHSVNIQAEKVECNAAYEPEFDGLIRDGAAGIFTFRAEAGYRLDRPVLEEKGIFDYISYDEMTGSYTCRINAIHSDYFISLKAKELYTISCISGNKGTVTTVPAIAAEGDTISIVATAKSGYKLGSVHASYLDGAGQIADIAITYNTFVMPAAAVTVTAIFEAYNDENGGSNGGGGSSGGGGTLVTETAPETLKAAIEGSKATLSISDDMLAKILSEGAGTGTVLIDVSGLEAEIDTVVLPNSALSTISAAIEEEGSGLNQLSVAMSGSMLTFDGKALSTIVRESGNEDIILSVKELDKSELSESERSLVGDNLVLDMSLFVGSRQISDFEGGIVTACLPYELKEGETADGLVVWYMSDKGELTSCICSYEDGMLTFSTTHFSKFIAAYFPFKDLKDTDWYYESIVYAFENNLFKGTGENSFSPNSNMTRAMLVTVLYRYDGASGSFESSFSDVASTAWYRDAVAWGAANGIIGGFGDGSFGPDTVITREQLAVILYRYGKIKNYDLSASSSLDSFKDGNLTSSYAISAMQWASGTGLISGKGSGILDPKGKATRAEVAAILMRLFQ